MIRGAIFDLDGVLLDSMGIWNDLGARYLRSRNILPEPGLNRLLFSMSMEQGAAYLKEHYPLPQSAAEIRDGIARMLADFYFFEVPAKPGAAELLDFLDNADGTLVLCRAALPFAQAGPGFAYSAPGRELREVWKDKMTNAISGASLVSGWLPIFGPETIAELEPALAALEQ